MRIFILAALWCLIAGVAGAQTIMQPTGLPLSGGTLTGAITAPAITDTGNLWLDPASTYHLSYSSGAIQFGAGTSVPFQIVTGATGFGSTGLQLAYTSAGNVISLKPAAGANFAIGGVGGGFLQLTSGVQAQGVIAGSVAAALAAAGTTQGTAAALTAQYSSITSGTGGVIMTSLVGTKQSAFNKTGAAINIYPPSGAAIGALATNAAYSLAAGGSFTGVCVSATDCEIVAIH